MRRTFRFTLFLVSLVVGMRWSPAQIPEIGQTAPAFSLSTPEGRSVSLTGLTQRGAVALIVLRGYPGYQCPYCTRQVHDFIANADKFAAAGVQVLLVYPGPPAELDQHAKNLLAKENPLPDHIHLVLDPDYKFTNTYGLRWEAPQETAYPSTFLIDRNSKVFYRKVSKGHGDRATAADVLVQLQTERSGSR
ncbi:MAG: redoxin family protein [Acidobacteriaceae bacterium]